MTFEEIHARLAGALGERLAPLAPATPKPLAKDPFAVVQPGALLEACTLLRRDPALAFDCLQSVAGVDYPARNQLEVVYHLWSYAKRHAFVLKVQLDRAAPRVASLVPLWSSANWLERETFDLLGVVFEGHPDLRRILLPDDWVGHPLRRDYEEQPSWHGISTTRESPLDGFVRMDELKKKVAAAAAASKAAAQATASEPGEPGPPGETR